MTNNIEDEIERVVQSVNEWDDRTSPDDYPEHLLITSEELADILRNFAEAVIPSPETNMRGWQDISTAPKDNSSVLVAIPGKEASDWTVCEAYFDPDNFEGGDWWLAGTRHDDWGASSISDCMWSNPTHWMPLPPAPGDTAPKDHVVGLDWTGFKGVLINKEWLPDDQELIYTAMGVYDRDGDMDEDAREQIIERLLAAWKRAVAGREYGQ
jgi:hypothetical protein